MQAAYDVITMESSHLVMIDGREAVNGCENAHQEQKRAHNA